MLCKGRK